ncbi:MAG: alpha-mannosyltransferase [Hyphomicrobiales bacterium]|nr:MAG: alpha-mannosyltransferase [Hyphomicrobiales bacterium]
MSKILIVTDAWHPQINGVVRSLERVALEMTKVGETVEFLTPQDYRTLPCPTYPEIRLSLTTSGRMRRRLEEIGADHVHIATEGPLGISARRAVLAMGQTYTTSYHTRFPEYLSARFPVPERWTYAWLRRFHNGGSGCMVTTATLEKELAAHGFRNLMRWARGVDAGDFRPDMTPAPALADLPRPIFMNVGRVAVEKNLEAFLKLDLPGTKVIVGDGPAKQSLQARYPDVVFTGAKVGDELVSHYTAADVFVFPSLTDTFGNVLLEALACGVPVAAYPVVGPIDIIGDSGAGVLDWDLQQAALGALDVPRDFCRDFALTFSWEASAAQFLGNIHAAHGISTRNAA